MFVQVLWFPKEKAYYHKKEVVKTNVDTKAFFGCLSDWIFWLTEYSIDDQHKAHNIVRKAYMI